MAVELRGLRWAITAAHHQSLRQAADSLNIRQSTLSRGLRDLEYQLGAVLFERSNSGTRPTAAGREFLDTARQIIAEIDTAFTRLQAHCRGETGRLTVGVCAALSAGNLRATLMDYQHRFPDVDIYVADRSRVRLLSDLATDAIDVAIMMGRTPNWDDRTLPLWHERVVIALPEGHPLCRHRVIQWTELEGQRWLISQRDPGPEFHELLIRKLGCSGLGHLIEHDAGIDRLFSLVGTGLGATLVAEGATGAAYPGVVYREVHDENGATRIAFMACWRQANDNPTLSPFLAMLRERYPDLATPTSAVET